MISGTGVLFTPSTGVCGSGIFTYYAVDQSGGTSNLATGNVTITCSDIAPVAVNDTLTINEDST